MGWNAGIPLVSLVSKTPDTMVRYSEVLNNQKIASSFQLYYHSLVFVLFLFLQKIYLYLLLWLRLNESYGSDKIGT